MNFTEEQKTEIMRTPEFEIYLKGLSRLAFNYIPSIRAKLLSKALEMYHDPAVVRLVNQYYTEQQKLEADLFGAFRNELIFGEPEGYEAHLEDSCLNNAKHYHAAIMMLFDV